MEKKKSSNPLRGFWGLCLVLIASLLFFTACEQNHDEKATITKLADLSGKKVAVLNGTNIPALLVKEVPGIQCQIYPDNASALQALDKDEVSAVAGDALVLSRAMQGEMEGHFLDESLPQEQYVFAVTKDNLSLAGAIDDTILSCKDTGIYMDMVERWLQDSEKSLPDELPTFENATPNGTLCLGVANMAPFAYQDGAGQALGFDVELAQRVADVLGKELVVRFYNITDLLPALKAGEIEMASGCLTVTEARSQEFSFSQPYWESSVSLLVK